MRVPLLGLLIVGACGGGARDVAPGAPGSGNAAASAGAADANANAGDAAAVVAPCPPAPPLDCAGGFELAWDGPARTSRNAAALVTRAGISTLLWSPRHGSGRDAVDRGVLATRACGDGGPDVALPGSDGGADVMLPGSDDAYLVTAVASATVTAAIGVLPGAVTHRYEPSTLLLWTDRGAGFGAPVPLSESVPRHVAVQAVAGADGSIALAWFGGDRDETLMFARLADDGALSGPSVLGRVPYGIDTARLVALPAGGWAMVQAGRSARRITASIIAADGTAGPTRTLVDAPSTGGATTPIAAGVPGGFALTWDGEAIAIVYETGDYGRDASPTFDRGGSAEPAGTIGWSAQPDTHALHFLRVAPDLTPLGPPITLDRAADVDRPAALVQHAGHYYLLGATMSPTPRRPLSPHLVRFTRTGTITHLLPLPIPTLPWRATLTADGPSLRGTLTSADLRPFTLRCAAP